MTSLSARMVSDLTEMTMELPVNQPREALAISRGKATSSPTPMVRTHQVEEVPVLEAVAIERSSKVEEIPSSLEMIEATETT